MNDEMVEKKKNSTNKILIAIIIILLLALGGLSYYTFFARDKEVDKPNPVTESTDTSNSAKEATLKSTVQMVAAAAEIKYSVAQTLGTTFPTTTGTPCGDWAGITIGTTSDYASCTYGIDSGGIATVKIKGTTTGKFSNWSKENYTAGCSGTRLLVTCINNDNSVVEPTTPVVEPTKRVEEIDYTIDTYEGTYSTYTADTKEIDKIVTELPYSNIINENISHNQLWKTYKVFSIVGNLSKTVTGCSGYERVSHKDDIKDSEGVVYPNYTTEEEKVAKDCGLTVEEISKINKTFWERGGGQYCNILYDMDELKTKYRDVYDEMFNQSFIINQYSITLPKAKFYTGIGYDHGVDKLIGHSGGGSAIRGHITIVDSKESNNKYIVEVVEGIFHLGGEHFGLEIADGSITTNVGFNSSDAERDQVLKENQDKLPHYVITFKLVDGYYQFDSIVKK